MAHLKQGIIRLKLARNKKAKYKLSYKKSNGQKLKNGTMKYTYKTSKKIYRKKYAYKS